MSRILGVLIVFFLSISAASSSAPNRSRSLLRTITGENANFPDAVVDLNGTNFESVLRNSPASYAIVEFFAHWCPACRNYKPQYEKVARLFNGPNAAHPGIVLMARVDCASKINTKLCGTFSVSHYPMLLWGHPSKFASGGWQPRKDKSDIVLIDNGRTADRLLNWINKQLGSSFNLDDQKYENERLQSNVTDPEQIARAIYDVEEATSTAFNIILESKMIKSETRGSLIRFLQLLVAHHPSKRCRKGSADILMNFDDLFPSDILSTNKQDSENDNGKALLNNFHICGTDVPRGYWIFCHGSRNDTRGFSCGLWVLLHSLSVRIDDRESQQAFTAVCDFIHNFFICEECRVHFYEMCSSLSRPFNKSRDFALWLWSAHNQVNERLIKEEASVGTGDPKFPKIMWPPKQLCASCSVSAGKKINMTGQTEWNEDEVFKFLVSYYGTTLANLYKDKSLLADGGNDSHTEVLSTSNAIVVPVGAALVIALASCAFAVLAWVWRLQQKNRKYSHRHSLKRAEEKLEV
ncbi:Thioredoxin domain, partial [Dillenia turbinata]